MITEAAGVPLAIKTTAANVHDSRLAVPMVQSLPSIQGPRGRPRRKPGSLLGDRAYGAAWIIAGLKAMRIRPLLAKRGTEHGSGLGRWRYVVERTMAWFGHFRRIKVCYERCGGHFQAFHDLASCVICARKLKQVVF